MSDRQYSQVITSVAILCSESLRQWPEMRSKLLDILVTEFGAENRDEFGVDDKGNTSKGKWGKGKGEKGKGKGKGNPPPFNLEKGKGKVKSEPPRMVDIGTFGTHDDMLGTEILQGRKQGTLEDAQEIVAALGCEWGQSFALWSGNAKPLNESQCQRLVELLDQAYKGEPDLKVELTPKTLISLIGHDSMQRLLELFGDKVTAIKLRRVEAKGNCINFHKDVFRRTLQVALTDEQTYSGGRLVFITGHGFEVPKRPAGCATVHNNMVAHGVTKIESGIRYGLFFLNEE